MRKAKEYVDENGEEMDAFAEMLHVMDVENLIRFRWRLNRIGRKAMVKILSDEIDQREAS
jgi:hypothetical protein